MKRVLCGSWSSNDDLYLMYNVAGENTVVSLFRKYILLNQGMSLVVQKRNLKKGGY